MQSTEPKETIGRTVARLRRASGISGTELARRSGMSRQSLSRIERKLAIPKVRVLLSVLRALLGPRIVADVTIPGRRIRTLREIYLLSRSEMGKLIRASWEQVYEWERGEIVPSMTVLRRVCHAFGLRLDFFFFVDDANELMAQERVAAMLQVGKRIRELAAARGLSLREVGRRAGLDRNRLCRICSGRVKQPRGRTLLRIAKVLGIGPLTFDRARIAPEIDRLDPFES